MEFFSKKPKQLLPDEQRDLDERLLDAAFCIQTDTVKETVKMLLAAGANVHAEDDRALRSAAYDGHTETVKLLLAAGANVHARDDGALRWAAISGHTKTVQILAKHIFAPDLWCRKDRAEIEAQAEALYKGIESENPKPERLRMAASILLDCALTCWEQVRPPPPKIQISPLPAQPRPL